MLYHYSFNVGKTLGQILHLSARVLLDPGNTNIFITFIQCWPNVEDVGPVLYKCFANVFLCLLGDKHLDTQTRNPNFHQCPVRKQCNYKQVLPDTCTYILGVYILS